MEEVDKYFKEEFLQGAEYGKEIKEFYVSNNKALEAVNAIGIRDGKGPEGAGKGYSGTRNPASDFTNAKGDSTLTRHFGDHGADFGYTTEQQYLNGARNFLEKPLTSTTQSFISNEGTYFRYDTATNEFGIINQYGGISTYYKPTDGINYWIEKVVNVYTPK